MKLTENVLKHNHLERRFLSHLFGCDWGMETFAFRPFLTLIQGIAGTEAELSDGKVPHYDFPNKPSYYLCSVRM